MSWRSEPHWPAMTGMKQRHMFSLAFHGSNLTHGIRAGFLGARDFFRKDALCANRFKGGGLGIKMLILCRDTRVADDHFASLPKNLQQPIGF